MEGGRSGRDQPDNPLNPVLPRPRKLIYTCAAREVEELGTNLDTHIRPEEEEEQEESFFGSVFRFMDRLIKRTRKLDTKILVGQEVVDFTPGGDEFVHLLETKFPRLELPRFLRGRIGKAIHEACLKSQPLVLYLHDTRQPGLIERFMTNTLCHPEAVQVLARLCVEVAEQSVRGLWGRSQHRRSTENCDLLAVQQTAPSFDSS